MHVRPFAGAIVVLALAAGPAAGASNAFAGPAREHRTHARPDQVHRERPTAAALLRSEITPIDPSFATTTAPAVQAPATPSFAEQAPAVAQAPAVLLTPDAILFIAEYQQRLADFYAGVHRQLGEFYAGVQRQLGEFYAGVQRQLGEFYAGVQRQLGEFYAGVQRLEEFYAGVQRQLAEFYAAVQRQPVEFYAAVQANVVRDYLRGLFLADGYGRWGGQMACIRNRESHGDYSVMSRGGVYRGAYQYAQSTWNNAAGAAGRGDLVDVNPATVAPVDQDQVTIAYMDLVGLGPWGGRCG